MFQVMNKVTTHIISGFLGAGKTTLLQHLFTQKPAHEKWAVLMNEFGQIGIDQHLLNNRQDIQIKEVVGGCLCCTSQLPMQIALSQLLEQVKPDRLFIEPSGLGHPIQLLEQLNEPHWQTRLDLKALTVVINGSLLHDDDWVGQYLDEKIFQYAQNIIISHQDKMTWQDEQALQHIQQKYQQYQQDWLMSSGQDILLSQINKPYNAYQIVKKPLLNVQRTLASSEQLIVIKTLPYFYQEQRQGYFIVGWKFSKRWLFDFDCVFDLFASYDYIRLKGIFNTSQGWIYFNCNPQAVNYKTGLENIDQRIEIISQNEQDWLAFEKQLLSAKIEELD